MSTKIKDKGVLEGEIADIINDISTKTMERNDEVKIITKYPPLVKKILKIQDELQEIDDYFNELPNLQSKVDEELSDLLHYIENNSLTPKQSAKMIKLIHKKEMIAIETEEKNTQQSILHKHFEMLYPKKLKDDEWIRLVGIRKRS